MPNRRRRKLSTAMSAVAALAVASPVAVAALSELPAKNEAPQHRQFVQAALITDLPGELISALSQGLSQFGVNLPPMPTGMLTGSPAASPVLTSPGLGATGLTSPGLTSPGLTPGLSTPGLGTPGLTPPTGLTPGLQGSGTTSPLAPGLSVPPINSTTPSLSPASLTDPTNTNPALTGAAPGLSSPLSPLSTPAGLGTTGLGTTGLGTPGLGAPGLGATSLGAPGEVPISAPIGLDPMAGTYPILGGADPLAAPAAASGGGGLLGDLNSAAQQLGAGQAIDLLKGMVMPAIQSAIKQGAPAAAAAAPGAAAAPALAAAPAAIAQVASGAGA
ncbi:hypothetical protein ACXPWS_00830 [Mycobacterium sp. BMJ-28]